MLSAKMPIRLIKSTLITLVVCSLQTNPLWGLNSQPPIYRSGLIWWCLKCLTGFINTTHLSTAVMPASKDMLNIPIPKENLAITFTVTSKVLGKDHLPTKNKNQLEVLPKWPLLRVHETNPRQRLSEKSQAKSDLVLYVYEGSLALF